MLLRSEGGEISYHSTYEIPFLKKKKSVYINFMAIKHMAIMNMKLGTCHFLRINKFELLHISFIVSLPL